MPKYRIMGERTLVEAWPIVNDTNLKSTDKIKSDEKHIAATNKVDI